jgi:hypothetical protein
MRESGPGTSGASRPLAGRCEVKNGNSPEKWQRPRRDRPLATHRVPSSRWARGLNPIVSGISVGVSTRCPPRVSELRSGLSAVPHCTPIEAKAEQRHNDLGSYNGISPTTIHKSAPHSRDHHSATTEFSSDRAPCRPSNRRSVLPRVNDRLQFKLNCRRPPLNPGISSPIRETLIFHNGSVFFRSPLSYYARSTKCCTAQKCYTARSIKNFV